MPRPANLPTSLSLINEKSNWGKSVDVALRDQSLQWCSTGKFKSTKSQGDALQDTFAWMISHVSGLSIGLINKYSSYRDSEVDLVLMNECPYLSDYGPHIFVELKNHKKKVSAHHLAWFDWKMAMGNIKLGIFVAAGGVTGDSNKRHSQTIIENANMAGRTIVVINRDQLCKISSGLEFTNFLKYRIMLISVRDPFEGL